MPPVVGSKKKTGITHDEIIREVRAGNIKPVYYLMGEESYYIDRLADFLLDAVLKPEERDFNLITLFGADTDIDTVINASSTKALELLVNLSAYFKKSSRAFLNLSR